MFTLAPHPRGMATNTSLRCCSAPLPRGGRSSSLELVVLEQRFRRLQCFAGADAGLRASHRLSFQTPPAGESITQKTRGPFTEVAHSAGLPWEAQRGGQEGPVHPAGCEDGTVPLLPRSEGLRAPLQLSGGRTPVPSCVHVHCRDRRGLGLADPRCVWDVQGLLSRELCVQSAPHILCGLGPPSFTVIRVARGSPIPGQVCDR